MTMLRRILGILVMIAGVIGLLLSLAGLVGLWMVKPAATASIHTTIDMLTANIDTSSKALTITNDALGTAVKSVEALNGVLGATIDTVDDTQPAINKVNNLLSNSLPSTFEAATASLDTAEIAAQSLEGAIKSLDAFRTVMGNIPILSAFLPASQAAYNPEIPLADSLGDLSTSIEDIPSTFKELSKNIDKADDNLDRVKTNLNIMSENVTHISTSLGQYQEMVGESQTSLEKMKTMLNNTNNNLDNTVNIAAWISSLFFFWLLMTQVVIFTQGWELYHGTANRIDSVSTESPADDGK